MSLPPHAGSDFARACDLLPQGLRWGDPILSTHVLEIARAARLAAIEECAAIVKRRIAILRRQHTADQLPLHRRIMLRDLAEAETIAALLSALAEDKP